MRAGMAVAQIPDLKNWEVTASIGELDRGHLSAGQKVQVAIVALPGKSFNGTSRKSAAPSARLGIAISTARSRWRNVSPGMRPGMSSNIVITTGRCRTRFGFRRRRCLKARPHVRLSGNASGFTPRDVKLVRRSESQVVLTGLKEGQVVALANPSQENQNTQSKGSAMKALSQ